MPTERIHSIAGEQHAGESDLELQWEKAGKFHHHDDDEDRGHVTLALVRDVEDGPGKIVDGYINLDRTMINRLVEKSRRARSQAYGADQ